MVIWIRFIRSTWNIKNDFKIKVINFDRIDLSDLDNKPSTFLDNDVWCNEVLSDENDEMIDEDTVKNLL